MQGTNVTGWEEFYQLVKKMREAQSLYWRTKSMSSRRVMEGIEKDVDECISNREMRLSRRIQHELFSQEQDYQG